MATRIVQFTSLHLCTDPEARPDGARTWEAPRAVLDRVRRRHGSFHRLAPTNGLAQDEALETGLMLREALGARPARLHAQVQS